MANSKVDQLYSLFRQNGNLRVFPIPRGGIPACYAIQAAYHKQAAIHNYQTHNFRLVEKPEDADLFIDDLVDSGATQRRYQNMQPRAQFMPLVDKRDPDAPDGWLVFPWEVSDQDTSAHDICVRLLEYIGEDPNRGGLVDTPGRYIKAWEEWTAGYKMDPVAILKSFEDGGEVYDEMVHIDHIPFYSQCEHHLAPFFGEVTFAYVPDKKVVGLSKMNRLVEVFSRRLQVQERMTAQIVDAFIDVVKPKGAAISVRGRHMCMESRGIRHAGCVTTTTALRGALKDGVPRAEFYALSAR